MKLLVLNGSPKCDRSNTIRIAKAFTEGFPEGTTVKVIAVNGASVIVEKV